jgi:hypothetical protein
LVSGGRLGLEGETIDRATQVPRREVAVELGRDARVAERFHHIVVIVDEEETRH